jgi:hypothetical protein
MRQFNIRPKRSPEGGLTLSIVFDPSVSQLSPVEQGHVFERAMSVALEAAKTATDPVIQRQREEHTRRRLVAAHG